MKDEWLHYFKEVLEGRARIGWRAWWMHHEETIKAELPRMQYLQLKFHNLDEAARILSQRGIAFQESPLAKRERYYALLHKSCLDEHGRPTEEHKRSGWGGAVGLLMDGMPDEAKKTVFAALAKVKRKRSVARAEELADILFDAQMSMEAGELGPLDELVLETVAGWQITDDLSGPHIETARRLLESLRGSAD